ncbi:MAG TPA: acyl carrier protein [Rhizomicrobium sp.]
MRDIIVRYVEAISNEKGFDPATNLFEAGVLTSLDVLSLVAFLEETFDLSISGDDIDIDHFGTIDGLVALVSAKQSQKT